MTTLPGARRLLIAWATLMVLTLISMVSARLEEAAQWQALPLWSASLVLLATAFKAHQVLMVYLNLRAAGSAWRGAFVGLLAVTLALIAGGYLAARWGP
ncbi:cytochrome C oxidase subunit IV family protein [Halomonas organivorans]